jgi:hypothetical protein
MLIRMQGMKMCDAHRSFCPKLPLIAFQGY